MTATDVVGPVLSELLVCAAAALPEHARAALYPGSEVAWDDCCDGQVWVRLVSLVPTGSPVQPTGLLPCGVVLWLATVGVGAVRCAHVVNDQGDAPSVAELTADTLGVTADAAALSQAIQCCMTAVPGVERLSPLRWDPLGPSGGCVGGEWLVSMQLPNCACPDA
jgi:hypothetical protein